MKKIGELVIPKDHPELQSRIKEITKDWGGHKTLYVLENGTTYTEDEIIEDQAAFDLFETLADILRPDV